MNLCATTPKQRDLGLLILRVGFGVMFIVHGYPKVMGGVEMWTQIGGAMGNLGINFLPAFWGFMAAIAEFGGGILIALGIFFRPAALLLAITMAVATLHHVAAGDGFGTYSHALKACVAFVALFFTGPGTHCVIGGCGKCDPAEDAVSEG